jgi:hypothetical protein
MAKLGAGIPGMPKQLLSTSSMTYDPPVRVDNGQNGSQLSLSGDVRSFQRLDQRYSDGEVVLKHDALTKETI